MLPGAGAMPPGAAAGHRGHVGGPPAADGATFRPPPPVVGPSARIASLDFA